MGAALAGPGTAADEGTTLEVIADDTVVASGKPVDGDTYHLEFGGSSGPISAIRLETSSDPTNREIGPGRTKHGNFVVSEFRAEAAHFHRGINRG